MTWQYFEKDPLVVHCTPPSKIDRIAFTKPRIESLLGQVKVNDLYVV